MICSLSLLLAVNFLARVIHLQKDGVTGRAASHFERFLTRDLVVRDFHWPPVELWAVSPLLVPRAERHVVGRKVF